MSVYLYCYSLCSVMFKDQGKNLYPEPLKLKLAQASQTIHQMPHQDEAVS